MREFMNIITESLVEAEAETATEAPVECKAGDFVQLASWFGDVWAYITYASNSSDDGRWMVQYCRRGKYGQADRNDLIISKLDNSGGYTSIKKIITAEQLKHELSKSSWLNVTLPQFKLRDGFVWKDGDKIGAVDRAGNMVFKDGSKSTLDAELEKAKNIKG